MIKALGFVEVRSLATALVAADNMLKTSQVNLEKLDYVGSGLIAIIVSGDVAAVTASVFAGKSSIEKTGKLIASNVIPNPHKEVYIHVLGISKGVDNFD